MPSLTRRAPQIAELTLQNSMQNIYIVGQCILAAVVYGIFLDQITVRICVEYFNVGHSSFINSDSPMLIGLFWGVTASWWVGLLLGVPLVVAARVGNRPKRGARSLARPTVELAVLILIIAAAAGIAGGMLASWGDVYLVKPLASRIPREKHVEYIAVLWAHNTSYIAGFVGGLALIVRTWHSRSGAIERRMKNEESRMKNEESRTAVTF
jgi:hypothetical protein